MYEELCTRFELDIVFVASSRNKIKRMYFKHNNRILKLLTSFLSRVVREGDKIKSNEKPLSKTIHCALGGLFDSRV